MPVSGDRSLQWDARIDLSKFKLDAKNIESIMNQLGQGLTLDTSGIDESIKQTAERTKKIQQDVVAEVQKANAVMVQAAQKAAKELKGSGITTILPEGFVPQ